MKKLVAVHRPSPAMAVALVSLFVGLGSSATAALVITGAQIRDGSVRSADIADGSLRSADIADGSLRAADVSNGSIMSADVADESLTGQDVLNGSLTPDDFSGSVEGPPGPKGDTGSPGPKGDTGSPGGFTETLPSGATIRGRYAFSGFNAVAGVGGNAETSISFVYRLTVSPTFHPLTHWIDVGAPTTAACPGFDVDGHALAAPGNACLYGSLPFAGGNVGAHSAFWDVNGLSLTASAASGPANFFGRGVWAYTAP